MKNLYHGVGGGNNKKTEKRLIQDVIIFFLFCSVILIRYREKITSENLFVLGDGISYYLSKVFFIDGIRAGEMPLWNPYLSIGTPFLADTQMSALSPFNILYFFLEETLAFNMTHILQLIIGGYFMYLLVRQLTDKCFVSIGAGFIFAFSTMMSGYRANHPTIVATIMFFPVIIYFMEKFRASNSTLWLMASSIFMAIQFISGFTQIVFYFDLVLFIYMLCILGYKKYNMKNILCICVKWIGVYVLLISVQLLPAIVLMHQSGRNRISWESFSSFSYDLRILLMMLFPSVYENRIAAFSNSSGLDIEIYIGVITLIYIIYEIVYCHRDKNVKLFAGIMAGAFVYGMLPHIPVLGKLMYHIPLFNSFRVCARSLPISLFFAIVLAGMGMVHIYEKESISKIIKINMGIIIVISISLFFAYCVFSQQMFRVCEDNEYYGEVLYGIKLSLILCCINLIGLGLAFKAQNKNLINVIILVIGTIIVADVTRFSIIADAEVSVESILPDRTATEVQKYIDEDTENSYRSFVAIDGLHADNLKIGTYNRAMKSGNYLYNSYITFIDEKLKYWEMGEVFSYPNFIAKLKSETDLASMIGLHYILDTGGHSINDKIVNENSEKELLYTEESLEMKYAGGNILIYNRLADWIEADTVYLVTVETNATPTSVSYADLYNERYDNPEQDGKFVDKGNGIWQTIIRTEDIPNTDVYFRIVISSDMDLEMNNLKIEKVRTSELFNELTVSEEGLKVYENENAKQVIYVPDNVVKIEGYGSNWKEDGFGNIDTISYVVDLDKEINLSNSDVRIVQIDKKRNSVSAIVYADREAFVNHSQLAYPGWKAYVDGKETKIYTVNNLIQGAVVPSGKHMVEFRFDPDDLKVGLGLTILGIIVCLVCIVKEIWKQKRKN